MNVNVHVFSYVTGLHEYGAGKQHLDSMHFFRDVKRNGLHG